jgi:hypothetical protein
VAVLDLQASRREIFGLHGAGEICTPSLYIDISLAQTTHFTSIFVKLPTLQKSITQRFTSSYD